jgi:hypothetical protein
MYVYTMSQIATVSPGGQSRGLPNSQITISLVPSLHSECTTATRQQRHSASRPLQKATVHTATVPPIKRVARQVFAARHTHPSLAFRGSVARLAGTHVRPAALLSAKRARLIRHGSEWWRVTPASFVALSSSAHDSASPDAPRLCNSQSPEHDDYFHHHGHPEQDLVVVQRHPEPSIWRPSPHMRPTHHGAISSRPVHGRLCPPPPPLPRHASPTGRRLGQSRMNFCQKAKRQIKDTRQRLQMRRGSIISDGCLGTVVARAHPSHEW